MFEGPPPTGAGAPHVDPTLLAWLGARLGQNAPPPFPRAPSLPPPPVMAAPPPAVMPTTPGGPLVQAAAAQDQIGQLLKLLRGFLPPQSFASGLDVGGQARLSGMPGRRR